MQRPICIKLAFEYATRQLRINKIEKDPSISLPLALFLSSILFSVVSIASISKEVKSNMHLRNTAVALTAIQAFDNSHALVNSNPEDLNIRDVFTLSAVTESFCQKFESEEGESFLVKLSASQIRVSCEEISNSLDDLEYKLRHSLTSTTVIRPGFDCTFYFIEARNPAKMSPFTGTMSKIEMSTIVGTVYYVLPDQSCHDEYSPVLIIDPMDEAIPTLAVVRYRSRDSKSPISWECSRWGCYQMEIPRFHNLALEVREVNYDPNGLSLVVSTASVRLYLYESVGIDAVGLGYEDTMRAIFDSYKFQMELDLFFGKNLRVDAIIASIANLAYSLLALLAVSLILKRSKKISARFFGVEWLRSEDMNVLHWFVGFFLSITPVISTLLAIFVLNISFGNYSIYIPFIEISVSNFPLKIFWEFNTISELRIQFLLSSAENLTIVFFSLGFALLGLIISFWSSIAILRRSALFVKTL